MAPPALFVILVTIFIPPVGVAMIAGCGADVLVNIILTLLGYLPGHIHAFYLEYIFYARSQPRPGEARENAPFVFSEQVQLGAGARKHELEAQGD